MQKKSQPSSDLNAYIIIMHSYVASCSPEVVEGQNFKDSLQILLYRQGILTSKWMIFSLLATLFDTAQVNSNVALTRITVSS